MSSAILFGQEGCCSWEFCEQLAETTEGGVVVLGREGELVDVLSTGGLPVFSVSDSVAGVAIGEVMHTAAGQCALAARKTLESKGGVVCSEFVCEQEDGSRRFALRASDCGASGFLLLFRDVCDDLTVAQRLRRSESMLRETQHIAGLGSWEDRPKLGVLTWSDEVYSIFGVDRGHFTPTVDALFAFIHPDDRERVATAFDAFLSKDAPFDVTHRIVLGSGDIRWVNEQAECFYGQDGKPERIVGTTLDVTARAKAERELTVANRVLEERARQLRRLGRQLSAVENRERQRLASVLHDNLQQLLVAAKYRIATLAASGGSERRTLCAQRTIFLMLRLRGAVR